MKGQGALEYLMTYGWALLIIVVVGAALYSLGVLNPATYTQSSCTGLQYFTFRDQAFRNSTDYSIELLNGNRDANITALRVEGQTLTLLSPTANQSAGASFVASGRGTGLTAKASGEPFTVTVRITYDVVSGISGNVDTATCTGRLG